MQEQASKNTAKAATKTEDAQEVPAVEIDGEGQERREKMSEDIDAILDEIDEVLEENAQEFVRAYVQQGGE